MCAGYWAVAVLEEDTFCGTVCRPWGCCLGHWVVQDDVLFNAETILRVVQLRMNLKPSSGTICKSTRSDMSALPKGCVGMIGLCTIFWGIFSSLLLPDRFGRDLGRAVSLVEARDLPWSNGQVFLHFSASASSDHSPIDSTWYSVHPVMSPTGLQQPLTVQILNKLMARINELWKGTKILHGRPRHPQLSGECGAGSKWRLHRTMLYCMVRFRKNPITTHQDNLTNNLKNNLNNNLKNNPQTTSKTTSQTTSKTTSKQPQKQPQKQPSKQPTNHLKTTSKTTHKNLKTTSKTTLKQPQKQPQKQPSKQPTNNPQNNLKNNPQTTSKQSSNCLYLYIFTI